MGKSIKKQVFVIIEGEYSDWSIVGYTDNEEDAMQICAQHNEKSFLDDWYYEAVDRTKSPEQRIELKYVHTIRFNREKNGVSMVDYFTVNYYPENGKNTITKTEVSECPAWIIVRVPLKENNLERAKKIAQDAIYKYLCEKQGN